MNSSCHPLLTGADGQSAREAAPVLDSPFIEQANFPFVKFCPRGLLSPAEPRLDRELCGGPCEALLVGGFRRLDVMGGWLFAIRAGAAALGSSAIVGAARAEAIIGAPVPGQIGFLPANTIVQSDIEWFHNAILLPITIGISLLVLALLAYVVYRFNEHANPVASRTVHNTPLEIAWTVLPALILVVIAVPSFRLLSQQLIIPVPDMTLKVTAVQWHWNYGYPKSDGGFSFDSLIKDDKDLKPGDIRLLSVDNAAYVPVGKIVEVDVVSQDVIHSFSMPSFGIKIDAVPGRLNKTWFKADHEGVFYGQCSNICGIDHAFMPIEIHVVSQDAYQAWLEAAKKQFATADGVDLAQTSLVRP
jgi:cytochrome c oxidase subunit II